MTTTENTQTTVLAHHGIVPLLGKTYQQEVDAARDHGVLLACLGCGSIVCGPEGYTTEDYYAAQPWAREVIESGAWDCCPDADSIIY